MDDGHSSSDGVETCTEYLIASLSPPGGGKGRTGEQVHNFRRIVWVSRDMGGEFFVAHILRGSASVCRMAPGIRVSSGLKDIIWCCFYLPAHLS